MIENRVANIETYRKRERERERESFWRVYPARQQQQQQQTPPSPRRTSSSSSARTASDGRSRHRHIHTDTLTKLGVQPPVAHCSIRYHQFCRLKHFRISISSTGEFKNNHHQKKKEKFFSFVFKYSLCFVRICVCLDCSQSNWTRYSNSIANRQNPKNSSKMINSRSDLF